MALPTSTLTPCRIRSCIGAAAFLLLIVLAPGPRAASLSDLYAAHTFPVRSPHPSGPEVLAPLVGDASSAAHEEGLYVPQLEEPAQAYTDLLWTKEDYRAWINGTGYQQDTPDDTDGIFPVSFLTERPAPRPGALSLWSLGDRNWRYRGDSGLGITLGSTEVGTPVLGSTATLGGVRISQASLVGDDDVNQWSLSMALGALDYSSGPGAADLSYGPTAANTVIRYGLSPRVSLESEVQVAPDLVTTSLGGLYDAKRWGRLHAGVARGKLGGDAGWRYQTAYDVNVTDALQLSVRNEWNAPGFADLGHYRDGVTGGVRRRWAATVPTRHWGDVSGTYESFRPTGGTPTERFGFSQQFWYSPNLRIGVEAQREVASGDYDIGIRFSVPIN